MSVTNRLVAGLVPLALALSGCPHRVDFGPSGEPRSAEELLKRIEVGEHAVTSVKGDAKLKIDSPQTKATLTLFAAVAEPANVHLEALDFFGKPQGVLVSDGKQFSLYDGQAGKFFRGPATAQNVARFVPIALHPAELAALLLGRSPRIEAESKELRFDQTEGLFFLTLTQGTIAQTLTIKPPLYRVVRSTITGLSTYDTDFESFEDVGGATYPRRVVLTAAASRIRIELNYKDVAVNEAPDPTMFQQDPPENVPVVEVDGQGNPR